MICIDSLKYDYYFSVVTFINDLVDGAKIKHKNDSYIQYRKCALRQYEFYPNIQKFNFSVAIDKEIRLEFKLKNNKEAINLYNVPSVKDMLIKILKP